MKNLFKCSLFGLLLGPFFALAATSTAKPECEISLIKGDGKEKQFVLDESWKKIFTTQNLTEEEKQLGSDIGQYFADAYSLRANGQTLGSMRSVALNAQAKRLLELQALFLEQAPAYVEAMKRHLATSLTQFEERVIALEKRHREVPAEKLAAEKAKQVRDHVEDISSRLSPTGKFEGDLDFLAQALAQNPERDLFEAKKELANARAFVIAAQTTIDQKSAEMLAALDRLNKMLKNLLAEDKITFKIFFQQQFFTAFIEDQFSHRFYSRPEGRVRPHEQTLWEDLEGEFTTLVDQMTAWSQTSGSELAPSKGMRDKMRNLEARFKKGEVPILLSQNMSPRLGLTVAFLPIHPITYDLTERIFKGTSGNAGELFYWDLIGAPFEIKNLKSGDQSKWITAINNSWNNWFIMLGGEANVFENKNPDAEAASLLLLYGTRYDGSIQNFESTPAWNYGPKLITQLYENFVFWDNLQEEIVNPNLNAFLEEANNLPQYFVPTSSLKAPLKDEQWVAGTDLLIHRLRFAGQTSDDKDLRALLERFPSTATTSKYFVLKTVFKPKPEPQSGYRLGRPAF